MINKNKNQGFTLMELMIAVAILGILTSIAIPSYTKYVREAKRTEAKTEMLKIAQLQESYYVQNLSYALAMNGTGGLGFSGIRVNTESGLYKVQVWGLDSLNAKNNCDGENTKPCVGYLIQAIPIAGAGQDLDTDCKHGFQLYNTGLKRAKASTGGWGNANTANECWN